MFIKQILAIGLLAAVAATAHTQEAKKDPKTGKSCVIFVSSEVTNAGRQLMHFRNVCTSPFQIRIQLDGKVREKAIEPGSPEKPSRATVTCTVDDGCSTARWRYE